MKGKESAAHAAVARIIDGMTVGLGSGSTAEFAIRRIGERIAGGLRIQTVASSRKSEALARSLGIPVSDPEEVDQVDVAIDGADEIDADLNLLKGGGGSLLREKVLAYTSQEFIVIADKTKLVTHLGSRPVPVEVTPFGLSFTARHLAGLGARVSLRRDAEQPFVTDNGNLIIDCRFSLIDDVASLDVKLKMIPGVVETGLFPGKIVTEVLIGAEDGTVNSFPPVVR
jgi:ribose 5-phosphate isomerase A